MTDINLQTLTPDTTLPTTGFLFGADSQASGSPSVFTVQSVATTLLGSTTLTGATITADAPVLNLAQTWNNAAITFTGLKLNATDTASAAGSLLMDLQVGGASKFSVSKAGRVQSANDVQINNSNGLLLNSSGGYIIFGLSNELILTRRGTANLRFGNADAATAVPQILSVQSVVAGTTNTAGAALTITGSQGTGTGAGGSIIFQVAPAGSSGTAQNALSTALTIASDRSLISTSHIAMGTTSQLSAAGGAALASPADSVWQMRNNAGNDFNRLQFGGGTSAFPALKRNSTALETKLADDSAYAPHAMQYLDVTDGITAPAAATGRARIYVDTADGDLKVIFADGTVKTIVTDT